MVRKIESEFRVQTIDATVPSHRFSIPNIYLFFHEEQNKTK